MNIRRIFFLYLCFCAFLSCRQKSPQPVTSETGTDPAEIAVQSVTVDNPENEKTDSEPKYIDINEYAEVRASALTLYKINSESALILGTIPEGTILYLDQRSAAKSVWAGEEGYWYRIGSGKKHWVFGNGLEFLTDVPPVHTTAGTGTIIPHADLANQSYEVRENYIVFDGPPQNPDFTTYYSSFDNCLYLQGQWPDGRDVRAELTSPSGIVYRLDFDYEDFLFEDYGFKSLPDYEQPVFDLPFYDENCLEYGTWFFKPDPEAETVYPFTPLGGEPIVTVTGYIYSPQSAAVIFHKDIPLFNIYYRDGDPHYDGPGYILFYKETGIDSLEKGNRFHYGPALAVEVPVRDGYWNGPLFFGDIFPIGRYKVKAVRDITSEIILDEYDEQIVRRLISSN